MLSISVVIPVYNRVNKIRRALDSVLQQSYSAKEVIVVDDGSIDGTVEYIQENYPQVTVLTQSNQGPSAARNNGIRHATGEWVALLDSDDIWLPDKLRVQAEIIEKIPGLGLVASQKYKNRLEYPVQTVKKPSVQFIPFARFLKRTTCHTSTVMLRREALEKVGLFDQNLQASEDMDLWARVAYHYKVARVVQPLVAVFESEDSISLSRAKKYFNDIRVLAKWDPRRQDTLDVNKRISYITYQKTAIKFTLLRGLRLLKYLGQERTKEFLTKAEELMGLSKAGVGLIYGVLWLRGLRSKGTKTGVK